MRDFRDAKAMAQTLRDALNAKSVSLTHSECLEIVARILGFQDWNVLSAKISTDKSSTDKMQPEGRLSAAAPDHPTLNAQRREDNPTPSGKTAREEVELDAAILDGYVGFYQLHDNAVLAVTRHEGHLAAQLTGQQSIPIYAQSNTGFFAKVVNAQISFITDEKGQAISLILHQGGKDSTLKRIDTVAAQEVEKRLAEKVKSQSASPGTEAALHRLVEGLISGTPNYQEMTPALAEATRQQLANLHSGHRHYGAIQSVTFLGVGSQGEDVYTVSHENGASHWRVALDSKGLITFAWVTPGP